MIEVILIISGFLIGVALFGIILQKKKKERQQLENDANEQLETKEIAYKKLRDQKELLVKAADDFISKNQSLIAQLEEQKIELEEEQCKNEKLLLNILPEEIVRELKLEGSIKAKLFDSATVLFTDFEGFTALSEKTSPEELIKDLNTYFSEFDKVMVKYGLEKIKTIGDAYMAVGGLPRISETHAFDVVSAALEINHYVDEIKRVRIKENKPYYDIRVGVHSGPVIAGVVGLTKFQYDIWGDTVNVASRMEGSGEVGKVNVSESTYSLLKRAPTFIFEERGRIETKGKGFLNMYFAFNTPDSQA